MLTTRLSATTIETGEPSGERLSRRAYLAIRTALKTGELQPGQKLILRPLAARLGLSATPVREALLRLVSEQALGLDGRSTVLVPTIGTDEFEELRELRVDLEGRAAEVAARRSTGLMIAALQARQEEYREAAEARDPRRMLEADDDFHRIVLVGSNRTMLLRMVDTLQVRLGPLLAATIEAEPLVGLHPHQRLIEAFRQRDGLAARVAMEDDLALSFDRIARHLRVSQVARSAERVA